MAFGYVTMKLETMLKELMEYCDIHKQEGKMDRKESRTKRVYKLSVQFIKKKTEMICSLSIDLLQEEKKLLLKSSLI